MVNLLTDYSTQIYHALSTDARPSADPGAQLREIDTGKRYIFDGSTWLELPEGGGGGGSILPTGYTQLEFIAGDGASWINTGEYRQSGDELDIYGGLLRTGGSFYWHPFGTGECFIQFNGYALPTRNAVVCVNSTGAQTNISTATMLIHTKVTDTQVVQYSKHGYDKTTVLDIVGTVPTDSRPMALFARKTAESADYPANGFAIFNFRWYRTGVLIHNMVPAMRDADEVLGMYDTVTNTFLTNAAGSGAFWGETID